MRIENRANLLPSAVRLGETAGMLQLVWLIATIAIFALAIMPAPLPALAHFDDSVLHTLAFMTLLILSALAWPRLSLWWLLAGLASFGALIELAQGLPVIGRDANLTDWLIDVTAALAALAPVLLIRMAGR